jgi:hypothetical protein
MGVSTYELSPLHIEEVRGRCNNAGVALLGLGFLFQLAALLLDP